MRWLQCRGFAVLRLGGKNDEASAALEQSLARFERKGNLVMAERVRARLAELLETVCPIEEVEPAGDSNVHRR